MEQQAKKPNPWADTPEEKEASANGGGFSRVENLKMQQGENVLRIVGTYKMFEQYWLPNVKRTVVAGPRKNCPIFNNPDRLKFMEEGRKLKDEGKDEAARAAFRKGYSFEPKVVYAVNVVDKADGTMKVWKFSRNMKEEIMSIVSQFGDPTEYDLVVTRTGTKLKTKYKVTPVRERSPLTEEEKKLRVHNLNKLFQPTAIEKVQSYLRGVIPEKKSGKAVATNQEEAVSSSGGAVEDIEPPSPEELDDLGNF